VDLLTQLILVKHGLTPNKDVTSIVIGTPEELATALRTGRIAACLLSPPRQLILYREGFSRLAYSGDYLPSYPSGGVGATEEKIKNNPAEVLSFVRASLKGLQYYSQHRSESIDIISKYLGVKDLSLAGESLRSSLEPDRRPKLFGRFMDARRHRFHEKKYGRDQGNSTDPGIRF
jgi:ABC-type nitrate/sulfonate/bicarbonate transport system substrate-binding protein